MTMIIDGTNGLTYPNSTVQASAGVVLQVVQTNSTSSTSTTSTSFVATGFSASITPKSTTSKILVQVNSASYVNTTGVVFYLQLYRGTTPIGNPVSATYLINALVTGTISFSFLDSPATTASTTYNIYAYVTNGSYQGTLGWNNSPTTITLMEIAG